MTESSSLVITATSNCPKGCSFDGKLLLVNNEPLAFIYYKNIDEIWMPAKPVMKITGEANITHIVNRVFADDKRSFSNLVTARGLPSEGCYGFVSLSIATNCKAADATQIPFRWGPNRKTTYYRVLAFRGRSGDQGFPPYFVCRH
jgi:hypothetical protein